jgi:hypothetical protein
MIAVRVFASRALRRAGYHHHAAECEVAADLEIAGRTACIAQHAIGRAHRDIGLTGCAQIAYGIAAQSANAVVAATSAEDRSVPEAGERAACALLGFERGSGG